MVSFTAISVDVTHKNQDWCNSWKLQVYSKFSRNQPTGLCF